MELGLAAHTADKEENAVDHRIVSTMLRIAGGVALLAFGAQAQVTGWRFAGSAAVVRPRAVEGINSFSIATEHPTLGGTVRFDASGRNLTFQLQRNGLPLWEKPAPSTWVMIPRDVDLVVFVGQVGEQGVIVEGPNRFAGLSAYDAQGNALTQLPDTGVFGRLRLLPDGRVLYLASNALSMVDLRSGGEFLWSAPAQIDEVELLSDGRFFRTGRWYRDSNEYETTLHDGATGARLVALRAGMSERPFILGVSSDLQVAFVRRTQALDPLVCAVEVYDLRDPSTLVSRIDGLAGAPMAADWSAARKEIAVTVAGPEVEAVESGAFSVSLQIHDVELGRVFEHTQSVAVELLDRASVRFAPNGDALVTAHDSIEHRYERGEVK